MPEKEAKGRWWDIGATCSICGHKYRYLGQYGIIMVAGIGVPNNLPDKVECPQCEELYGDLDV